MDSSSLIVVRQLPIIEDQLREIKASVEARVEEALALACTEETRQEVKAARADLNREFGELEARRKEVKAAIMAPYEAFEALYQECAGNIYKNADAKLKARIDEVENGLHQQKADEVAAYFDEYRASLGIGPDFVDFSRANISITLSASMKSLKAKAKAFLDRIDGDLSVIETQERKYEVLAEYRQTLDLPAAIAAVDRRAKAAEAERQRRVSMAEQMAARAEAERQVMEIAAEDAPLAPPAAVPVEPEAKIAPKLYSTSFTVTGTLEELRALKKFLTEGGYAYEQC